MKLMLYRRIGLLVVAGVVSSMPAAAQTKHHSQLLTLDAAPPVVVPQANGHVRITVEGCVPVADPGRPAVPQRTVRVPVEPGIDWSTVDVEIVGLRSHVLPGRYAVAPAAPVRRPTAEGVAVLEWGAGKDIVAGCDQHVYGVDTEFPGAVVTPTGSSSCADSAELLLTFAPVQYNPVTGALRVIEAVDLELSYAYRAQRNLLTAGVLADAEQYDLVIVTTEAIRDFSTGLTDYVQHRTAQGYAVLIKTVEDIEAEYTRSVYPALFETTDERADRIKAFLKDKQPVHGFRYLLLVGDPDPDDPNSSSDSVGDVPMKFCLPDNHYGTKYAPSDQFYADLSGKWDLNANGLFGEDADRGLGGVDLAEPDLVVGRIPYYVSRTTTLNTIFAKIIAYETVGADESWKRKCLMPNPIDWTDNYGREGNMSPIWMAEWIKDNVLVPAGFDYYRIYEHSYDYPPHNVTPPAERIPSNLGYTCFTRYNAAHYFKAAYNVSSNNIADYPISALTDGYDTTAWSQSNVPSGAFLQFKTANQDDSGWSFACYRVVLRSDAPQNFPQQFKIEMANNTAFSDRVTLVTETNAAGRAVQRNGVWELEYEAPATLARAGGRQFIRLTYTGASPQAQVKLLEFLGYTEQNKSIQPYVIPEWLNRYGVVYFNTHGWSSGAADVITSGQCYQLDDAHPSFVFSKACSTAHPETPDNLCASLVFSGAIGSVGASRVSYGWGDHGYKLLMPRLVEQNLPLGEVYGGTCAEAAQNNYYGWGGYYEDALRFNLYGDPLVRLLTDQDEDGLPYWEEEAIGLDPSDPDSDGDGVDDGTDNCPLEPNPGQEDHDGNGIGDACDVGEDCNNNGVSDWYDIAHGVSEDCNNNGVPDGCELADGSATDCNGNGIPDTCDVVAQPPQLVSDRAAELGWIEIALIGTPLDLSDDGVGSVPLGFTNELFPSSTVQVANDGALGFAATGSLPGDNTLVPAGNVFAGAPALFPLWDDLGAQTGNVYWMVLGMAPDRFAVIQWYQRPHAPGDGTINGNEVSFQVHLFETPRDGVFAQVVYRDTDFADPAFDHGASATIGWQGSASEGDVWSFNRAGAVSPSTVLSLLKRTPAADDDNNGVPDECEWVDCNENGVSDNLDIARGDSFDCNANHIPDECDIADGAPDANGNGVPDACEPDCNGNGLPDDYDIAYCSGDPACGDCNVNGVPDSCDIATGTAEDSNGNGIPDVCEDLNQPPVVDAGLAGVTYLAAPLALAASVTDDGLPAPPAAVTVLWRQESGPGTAIFDDTGAANTTVTFDRPGTYVLALEADDGELVSTDLLQISVIAPTQRVTEGLLALYTFNEASGQQVYDVSGCGAPLDLTIGDLGAVTWQPGALTVDAATVLTSDADPGKIISACVPSSALTLETWIVPSNVTQDGPARIMALSVDTTHSNFVLGQGRWDGQASDVIDVRLRTTATNDNGQPEVTTSAGTLTAALTHVVYTRDPEGDVTVFLDGTPTASSLIGGNFSNWDSTARLALANEPGGGRPWLGTLHLAAIYSRALSAAEVAQNYDVGPEDLPGVPGDLNCDAVLDTFDIDAFILAMSNADTYAATYPDCDRSLGDLNGDGQVDTFDIDPFIAAISGN